MSLGQYLALTRSIKNVSGEGRYKVADTPVAPDFSRHGASTSTTSETGGEPPLVTVASPEPPSQPSVAVKPKSSPSVAPVVRRVASPGQGRWNWLLGRNRRRNPDVAQAVQRELALDLVKPICNDLSDSDLEAVPVAAPAEPVAEGAGTRAPVWRRWTGGVWQNVRRWLPGRRPG